MTFKEPLLIKNHIKKDLFIADVSFSYIKFERYNTHLDVTKYEGGLISFEVDNGGEFILNSEQWNYINAWKECDE